MTHYLQGLVALSMTQETVCIDAESGPGSNWLKLIFLLLHASNIGGGAQTIPPTGLGVIEDIMHSLLKGCLNIITSTCKWPKRWQELQSALGYQFSC